MEKIIHLNVLNELFDMLPKDTKLAGEIDGMQIYTNTAIVNYTKQWIKDHPSTRSIANKLSSIMDSGKIVIGHTSSNLISFLAKKTFKTFIGIISSTIIGKPSNGTTLGFYAPAEKRIVILLDGNTSMLGKSYYPIPFILVHECVHMIAGMDPDNFFAHSKSKLCTYYKTFAESIINSISGRQYPISDENITKLIENLLMMAEISPTYIPDKPVPLTELYDQWFLIYETIVKDKGLAEDCADLTFIMLMNITAGVAITNEMRTAAVNSFVKAYGAIGIRMPNTIPGQEAIFPSEVIAIANQNDPAPEIITMINNSKF